MIVRLTYSHRVRLLAQWALCIAVFAPFSRASMEGNLISQSPFLPPGWGAKTDTKPAVEAPVVQGPLGRDLEFRGIFEMGGVTKFSIFDKSTQTGHWYAVDDGPERFSIVRYDEKNDRITIKSGGRTEELTLATADDKPIPVAGAMPNGFKPPGPPPNFTPGSPPSGIPTTSPPTTIPPPPPAALLNARNADNSSGAVQRRRIIRRNDGTDSSGGSGSGSLPVNVPSPPNYTPPGAPPNSIPTKTNLAPPTSAPPN